MMKKLRSKNEIEKLYSSFKPIIKNSLDKVNATKYYGDLVRRYNQVPFVDKVNPDLDDYATNLAMKGLFKLVANEEANIRKDLLNGASLANRKYNCE